jgi:hypothetical protein
LTPRKARWTALCNGSVPELLQTDSALAYTNVVIWAENEEQVVRKARAVWQFCGGELLECEDIEKVNPDRDYNDE